MVDGMTIRALEPDDAESVLAISNCPGVRWGTLQMPHQAVASARERFARTIDNQYLLVAEIDGRVIGVVELEVALSPRRRHTGEIGMMVHDDVQGRGVGKALLVSLLDLADNWIGLRRLELTVFADNDRAIHLYQSSGFEVEGTLRDFALRDGVFIDAFMMGRIRPESA